MLLKVLGASMAKLLQQYISILYFSDHSQAFEVFELQGQIKLAQYAKSIEEFCQTLGFESEQGRVYSNQLTARDCDILQGNEQVNAFMLKDSM